LSGVENITNKILKDAEAKATSIIQAAEEKAALDKQSIIDQAKREEERILAEAKVLTARSKEQTITGISLAIRNQKLEAKQQIVEKVFSESLKRLNDMEWDDLKKFIAAFCESTTIKENDQIILPDKYKDVDVKSIDSRLSPYSGDRSVANGFILVSGGIEQNNTFSALLDFYKNDMEPEVISMLFQG